MYTDKYVQLYFSKTVE